MAKQEDRIDQIEKSQALAGAEMAHAAEAIRDQKSAIERLTSSITAISPDVAAIRSSVDSLWKVVAGLSIPIFLYIIGSSASQFALHSKLGQLDERTQMQGDSLTKVREDLEKASQEKMAGAATVTSALEALDRATKEFEAAQVRAKEIDDALRGPEHVMFVTLGTGFVFDSSEGDAILSWDFDIADIAPNRRAREAVPIHVGSAFGPPDKPAGELPTASTSVKILGDRKIRVRLAMNSAEDKGRIEEFFKGGGTMSMDIAIYLVAK